MDGQVYSIWLSLCCTPTKTTFKKLIDQYKNPRVIYELDEYELKRILGSRNSDIDALLDKDLTRASDIHSFCIKRGVKLLEYNDTAYPCSLRQIKNPPVILYCRGILPDFNSGFYTSVVGTRRLSDYGKKMAFSISHDLAIAGSVIVSGMAIGVDGVAHAAALKAGGITVAVLGSGIDICYPEEHLTLARSIVKSGCVITEFAPGAEPTRYTFPMRNRIVTALSSATVVIEGKERSGALISARYAKEQGKVVYALPGNVDSVSSLLPNVLLREGARTIMSADDLIRDFLDASFGALNPHKLPKRSEYDIEAALTEYKVCALTPSDKLFKPGKSKKKSDVNTEDTVKIKTENNSVSFDRKRSEAEISALGQEYLEVYKRIPDGGAVLDTLVSDDLDIRTIMRAVLKLELKGYLESLPQGRVGVKR